MTGRRRKIKTSKGRWKIKATPKMKTQMKTQTQMKMKMPTRSWNYQRRYHGVLTDASRFMANKRGAAQTANA